jgi:hypothetical protein
MNMTIPILITSAAVGFLTFVAGFLMGLLLVEHITWCGP